MDKEAADSCWPCPKGKKTMAEGADSLDACVDVDENSSVTRTTFSTAWTVLTICVIVFLILSWILIILLVFRLHYWRRWRKKLKNDAKISYSKKGERETIKKTKSHKQKPNNGNANDKNLNSIKEKEASQTDLEDFQSRNAPNNHSLNDTCTINSPAKNNYFYINQNPNTVNKDLSFRKTSRKKPKRKNSQIQGSNSESDSTYNITKDSVSDIALLLSDASTESKELWFKEEKRELSLESQNAAPYTEQKEVRIENLNKDPIAQEVSIKKADDPLLKLNSSSVELKEIYPTENNPANEKNILDMGNDFNAEISTTIQILPETENTKKDVSNECLKPNRLKSGEKHEIVNISSFEKENSRRSSNYSFKSFKQKPKSWTHYTPLYTPQFNDVMDFRHQSYSKSLRSRIETDLSAINESISEKRKKFKINSPTESQAPEEIRIIIEPDEQGDDRTIAKDIISSETDTNQNICPLHSDFNPLEPVPCHVDLCLEFLM